MFKTFILLLLFVVPSFFSLHAQTDSLNAATKIDSTQVQQLFVLDSAKEQSIFLLVNYRSLILLADKPVMNDIEQVKRNPDNGIIFFFLLLLLIILAYLKTAFSKDIEELIQSLVNSNMAQQIFRTQTDELSVSSLLLLVNFIVVFSLYMRYVVIHFYHTSTLENFSSILFLNFLFTFFYVSKVVVMRIIGWMFELNDVTDQYIFNFSSTCKTLGLTVLPTLFIFYAAHEKYFNFIFIISLIVIAAFIILLVLRWLSTSLKLLYRSVYHFFIYVCIGEVLIIFLYLKLFTKTII